MFTPDMYEHIRITNKRNLIQTSYNIHGLNLKETTQAKYLGVPIDNKLSWNCHADQSDKEGQTDYSFSPKKSVQLLKR